MMARFNRGMALRPVHRIKHVVDSTNVLGANSKLNVVLISTKDAPVIANTPECETGSKVNGIYLRVEAASNMVATPGIIPNVYLAIMKIPGNSLASMNPNVVGASVLKKYVIHQEMVMLEKNTTGNPRTLFAGVIKLPRGYRRMGTDDALVLNLFSPGVTVEFCVQCIYKEYR